MVAKLTFFSVKLQNCRQQSKSTFLDLFIIAKKIALTYPLNACSGTNGSKVKINLRRKNDGSLLCKMQGKERNERPQGNNDEKRPTGNPGRVPNLRHQDVQDR